MSYCLTPGCIQPQNLDRAKTCQSCGFRLRLKGRYRAVRPLGKGGFGRTFLAVDEDIPSHPPCVIKQLCVSGQGSGNYQKAAKLFHQEAVRLHELGRHPQIPTLLAHCEQNKLLYLVQEFIEGNTLSQELRETDTFDETKILTLLRDVLPVLQFIHERHVIHRDIKPANLMRRQNDGKLILIDFGIAKVVTGTAMLQTGTAIGSPEFMAPEQTRGKAFPASDIYGLGTTCVYLMTGVSPFELFDVTRDCWMWRNFLPPEVRVSDRLGQVLDKMLQNSLNPRYHSATEVLKAIDRPEPKLTLKARSQPDSPVSTVRRSPRRPFWQVFRPSPSRDKLSSEVGLDYSHLQDLLAARKWKAADRETRELLCQSVGHSPHGYLDRRDIQNLPCEDLQTIDRLWVKYSQGRFGFSVQQRIYRQTEQDYLALCDRVGWRTYRSHIRDSGLQFKFSAPEGHLPSRTWIGGIQWWEHAQAIVERLEACEIRDRVR